MLIKFGQEEHLNAFVQFGSIYFNNFEFFQKIEDNHLKGDKYEGTELIIRPEEILKIRIDERQFEPILNGNPIRLNTSNSNEYFTHLACYCIIESKAIMIDGIERVYHPKMSDLGDYFVFIHNTVGFFNRIKEKIKKDSLITRCKFEKVQYVDIGSFSGEFGHFRKFKEYEYQNEARLAICNNSSTEPFIIKIGSLEDFVIGPLHKSKSQNIVNNGHGYI